MKHLWSAISFLAVVHLLAMAMFVGWLWQSNRLSRQRVDDLKALFAPTLEEEQAARDAQAEVDEQARLDAAEQARADNPPGSSADMITQVNLIEETQSQALQRLQEEVNAHQRMLRQRAQALDARETALDARDTAWREANQAQLARATDEQFQKTVALYSTVPAKQAKQMLLMLVAGNGMDQAVAYVNAMNPRTAAKIIKELKSEPEVQLATQLLENLRTFGLPPEEDEVPGYDDTLADAD
jgi:flagellar motility protein MotE (MotC chaperone)